MGFHTGPQHPNGTADVYPSTFGCGMPPGSGLMGVVPRPCLFDVYSDEGESNDLNNPASTDPVLLKVVSVMEAKYKTYCKGVFQSSHMFLEPNKQPKCESVQAFAENHRGFHGPICK
jgi:hypothetical protein